MAKKITDRVTWVGKIDWELKRFHGDELSTHRGSSYNAYLVRDQKTALIDTVWGPYDREFVARLKEEIDLKTIDYIIMNHNEPDHSGALIELLREIPGTPVYCTAKGKAILEGEYHQDWNFVTVKTGDTLPLGDTTLTFIEAPMLHWPDTMFTYLSGEEILFSNDGFGQHYASEELFADACSLDVVEQEALKYYANILAPFSPMVTRKIAQIQQLNLPLKMICPSHGVCWRENPAHIIDLYTRWATNYQEDQITIVYDTMWQSTRMMAQAIAQGIEQVLPSTRVVLMNAARDDKNDILTQVFISRAVLVGAPTINNGYSYAIAGLLEMIRGLKLKNKRGASFGSYGWSGEAPRMIAASLREAGFDVADDGCRTPWAPDQAALDACREYGKTFAQSL